MEVLNLIGGGKKGYYANDIIPENSLEKVYSDPKDYSYLPYDSTRGNGIANFSYSNLQSDAGGCHPVDRVNNLTFILGVRNKSGELVVPGSNGWSSSPDNITSDCKGNWYYGYGSSTRTDTGATYTATVKKYNNAGELVWSNSVSYDSTYYAGVAGRAVIASEKQNRLVIWLTQTTFNVVFIFDSETGSCVFKQDFGSHGAGTITEYSYTVTYDYDQDVVIACPGAGKPLTLLSFDGEIISQKTITDNDGLMPLRLGHYYNGAIYGRANGDSYLLKLSLSTADCIGIHNNTSNKGVFINDEGCAFLQTGTKQFTVRDIVSGSDIVQYTAAITLWTLIPIGNGKNAVACIRTYSDSFSYITPPDMELIGLKVKEVVK